MGIKLTTETQASTRRQIAVRLSSKSVDFLDELAHDNYVDRSVVIRAILQFAIQEPSVMAKVKASLKNHI